MCNYLFVYGTLLEDCKNELSKKISNHSEFISNAHFNGKLFNVDWYPGAIYLPNSDCKVYGKVYKIEHFKEIIKQLDDYEGDGNQFESPNQYKREKIKISLEDESWIDAWVYTYNWPTDKLEFIPHGNYIQYLNN